MSLVAKLRLRDAHPRSSRFSSLAAGAARRPLRSRSFATRSEVASWCRPQPGCHRVEAGGGCQTLWASPLPRSS